MYKIAFRAIGLVLILSLTVSCQVGMGAGNGNGVQPSIIPTGPPTATASPTPVPTNMPTILPTASPVASALPTAIPTATTSVSLFATLSAQSRFSTLTEQLKRPEFVEIYNLLTSTTSRYTLFAPNNQAFSNLIASDPGLFSDIERLRKILLYHLVQGELPTTELVKITRIETLLNNNPIAVSIDDQGHVRFNTSATLSGTIDLKANNGYIQEVDMVLNPPNPAQVVLPVPSSTPIPSQTI